MKCRNVIEIKAAAAPGASQSLETLLTSQYSFRNVLVKLHGEWHLVLDSYILQSLKSYIRQDRGVGPEFRFLLEMRRTRFF